MARKTELQKARAAMKRAASGQRQQILRSLKNGESGPKIAADLGISHQRVYQVKKALIHSGELKA